MELPREIPPTSGLPLQFEDLCARADTLDQALAAFTSGEKTHVTCSGSAALLIALEYLKSLSSRRTVIMPAYSCPLVAIAARQAGLKVALCDIEKESVDLDQEQLRSMLSPDTLCVIPTHYGGYLSNVDATKRTVTNHSPEIAVIEDAAQAFGAVYDGKAAGTRGDIGFYSFAVGKGATLFEGGALTAANPLFERLQELSGAQTPVSPLIELKRCLQLLGYYLCYRPLLLPFVYGVPLRRNLRRNDVISAIGDDFDFAIPVHTVGKWRRRVASRSLLRLPRHLAESRRRYGAITQALESTSGLKIFPITPERLPACTFAFVRFDTAAKCDGALQELWQRGLGVSKLFAHAMGDYDYLKPYLGMAQTPNAKKFAECSLTISTSSFARDSDLDQILRVIRASAKS